MKSETEQFFSPQTKRTPKPAWMSFSLFERGAGGQPALGAHVRYSLDEHERQRASRLPARSVLNGPHWGPAPPQRGRQDLAFCKLLVAHLLGSPSGGAGTAAAVTERARRCRPGKTLRCVPSFLSCAAPIRARSRLFEKRRPKNFYARFARPTPCAHVRYSLDEHERQRAAQGANCLGCNPRARALFSRTGAAFSRRPKARIARGGLTPHPPCGFVPALFCHRWSWAARPHTLSHGGICRALWRASRGFAALSSAPGCPHSPWPAQWWP